MTMSSLTDRLPYLVACGLLVFALPAAASTWKPLTKDSKTLISADMASITKDGPVRRAWVRYDYFAPLREQNGKDTVTITAHYVMNCSTQMIGTEREIHHGRPGEINGEAAPLPMTKAAPGSINDLLLRTVCKS